MPPKQPPKSGSAKKAAVKQAEKIIEDKTFGMKNKNKSKTVQKFIKAVTSQAHHNAGVKHKTEEQKKAEAKAKKEAKDREQEELRMLFSQIQGGAAKRSKVEEAMRQAQQQKLNEKKDGEEKAAWVEQDMTGKPLEEVIEYQRAKLQYEGKNKTPVTAESFAKWKADKAEQKKRENAEKVAQELKKKTKGKGLSVLSGKDLFEYDASLFVDDEEANDESVDLTQLKGLMEQDEEDEVQNPSAGENGEEGGGQDGDDVAVAIQESLYLDDGEEDLDDIDDDDDDQSGGGAAQQANGDGALEEKSPR